MSPTLRTPSPTGTFLGVGKGMTGFTVNSIPPDTVGAVGRTQYVQVVNSSFAVFNKAGTKLLGPTTTKTLFSTLSGGCKNNNDGDGVVVYDKTHNVVHEWESSFIGALAIPAAMQGYAAAVQKLTGQLFADPAFVQATR